MAAAKRVKEEGRENDLLDRIAADPAFGLKHADLERLLNVKDFVGRAPAQVTEFVDTSIDPLLKEAERYGRAEADEVRV
jgi:adenylosuccinate lyase